MTDIVENDTDAHRIAENDADAADARIDAARSIERLRLAEGRLARRRQNECGPSENARAADAVHLRHERSGSRGHTDGCR
ncbi:hypothetical protein [Microbacterium luteum]|uniref:hypothetical protein n=1 Tax=Microbacterium luteum TaxID=2782167 RepID=UPI001888C74D|nr:hypothetical protein [Microbacterium luteum]